MLSNRILTFAISILFFGLTALSITTCKSRKSSNSQASSTVPETESACIFGMDSNRYGSPGADDLDLKIWQIINSLAIASNLAYGTDSTIVLNARKLGFDLSETIKSGSMSAIILSNKKCVVLSFRGTDMKSMRDWFVDLRASTEAVSKGRVHKGFYLAWLGLRRGVTAALKAHGAGQKTFWVTGHSLGGALAGLYAYTETFERVIFRGPHIHRIVTFGQPLFGDRELSDVMRKEFIGRYFRVVNGLDIVATVPFWLNHFGSLVWFHDDRVELRPEERLYGGQNNGAVSPAVIPAELAPTEDRLREFLELIKPKNTTNDLNSYGLINWPRRIADHFMKGYLERLQLEIQDLSNEM